MWFKAADAEFDVDTGCEWDLVCRSDLGERLDQDQGVVDGGEEIVLKSPPNLESPRKTLDGRGPKKLKTG